MAISFADLFTERGTDLYTTRLLAVDPVAGQLLTIPFQSNAVLVHWEMGARVASFSGMAAGSARIYLTEDGGTFAAPIAKLANTSIIRIYPPGATACDVSIVAW